MRNVKELYRILLDNTTHDLFMITGTCLCIDILSDKEIISEEEQILLDNHFSKQRPTKIIHPHFYDEDYKHSSYWWRRKGYGDDPENIRVEFILYLIENL